MTTKNRVQVRTTKSSKGNGASIMRATATVPGLGRRTVTIPFDFSADRNKNHGRAVKAFCVKFLMDLAASGEPEYAGTGIVNSKVCDYWNVNLSNGGE